jgi:quercetin dioxygenase-like cupin family protein
MKKCASLRVVSMLVIACGFAMLANAAAAAAATSTTPRTITRTELERSDVPGTDMETRLYLIVYPPGAAAPIHHHPVEGLGYIIEGTARSGFGTEVPVTLTAGQSFRDKANVPHTVFENADNRKPLVFVIAYTVKKGAPVVEMP